jgi:hypothetical protein
VTAVLGAFAALFALRERGRRREAQEQDGGTP